MAVFQSCCNPISWIGKVCSTVVKPAILKLAFLNPWQDGKVILMPQEEVLMSRTNTLFSFLAHSPVVFAYLFDFFKKTFTCSAYILGPSNHCFSFYNHPYYLILRILIAQKVEFRAFSVGLTWGKCTGRFSTFSSPTSGCLK